MMKSPTIILLAFTALLTINIFPLCLSDFVTSENGTSPTDEDEFKIEMADTMTNSNNSASANYSTADTSFYVREFMKAMKNQQLTSGANPKKAYYVQVSNKTEINSFGELVRYVLNSRAAPAIKTVFSNLDRDLFRLFTPSDSGKGVITDERLNIIIQHQYPTEEPSNSSTTPGSAPTTTKDAIRNLEEGDGDDEEEGDDDLVSKHSSQVSSKYKISAKVKTTTPQSTIDQEDDEEEANKL